MAIDSDWVADQARALLEDMPVDAFKIGVLGSVENIAAIAEIISDYPDVPLILDPVLASGRGDELASDEMTHAMRELLLPQTTILTPNSMEARTARRHRGRRRAVAARVRGAARSRPDANTCSSPARTRRRRRSSTRCTRRAASCAPTRGRGCRTRYHGSGCTLASAIAAMLANGLDASRSGARSAGLHVARARESVSTRHGPASSRSPVLGARGWRRARDGHAGDARSGCGGIRAAHRCPRHALSRPPRVARRVARLAGLYAVTPDIDDTALLVAQRRRGASTGGAAAIQYRNKAADAALRRDAGAARSRGCLPRRARCFIVNDDVAARGGRRRGRRASGRGRRRYRDGACAASAPIA